MISLKTLLKVEKVSKSFPGVQALKEVDLEIALGEVHALLGENGSGKSTLIKCIAGVYKRDSGRIMFQGKEISFSSPIEAFCNGISVIYQERSLIPKLSVVENVFLGSEFTKFGVLNNKSIVRKYRELCELYGFSLPPDEKVMNLGVAEQKIVEIMKALVRKSQLVIMDEPTAALSENEVEHLFKIIRELKSKNISVLYITHILEEVFRIADRITVLRDGKKIGTLNAKNTTKERVIDMMVGKVLQESATFSHYVKREGKPILAVENLKAFPRVKNISFNLYKGEVLGITGLTGSGKTEVARILFGVEKSEAGSIYIEGKHVMIKSPNDAIRNGIALVPEDRKNDGLVLLLEVYKNITLASLKRFSNKAGVLNSKEEFEETKFYTKRLGIKFSSEYQKTMFLSGGNQQKVVLAKWLLTKPDILIMDEATQGIDVKAKGEIYSIVKQLAEKGVSVIFISSDIPEMFRVADRILVFREGFVEGEFTPTSPEHMVLRAAIGGLEKTGKFGNKE